MTPSFPRSVLLLGGYGSLGTRTAQALRHLHPDLPLTIAGRDRSRAAALADAIGNATPAEVKLGRADLGLRDSTSYSVVVTALRDLSLNSMRFAEARRIPYVALSDSVFEIGPVVARHVHHPAAAAVLLLGHSIGAVPTLAALHLARAFVTIDAIEVGLVFDPDDPLGPASAVDMERIGRIGRAPLLLQDGRWRWVQGADAARRFTGVDGAEHQGQAVALVDALSLSSTAARSIRVDLAEGVTATRRRGGAPSHEVIIEIAGERADGVAGRFRYELVDPHGYATLSARGVAVAVERLLGLADGPPPGPGLYLPEMIVDPGHLVRRLETFDVSITGRTSLTPHEQAHAAP